MRLMKPSEIPTFVNEVIAVGCDICAVGRNIYVIDDVEQARSDDDELRHICQRYGDRDFLKLEIVDYLRSIGRYLDVGSPKNALDCKCQ